MISKNRDYKASGLVLKAEEERRVGQRWAKMGEREERLFAVRKEKGCLVESNRKREVEARGHGWSATGGK